MSAPALPSLSLRQLAYWLVVVEEGSLTAAARRLAITQPALSQQIRALERSFGGDLLERLPSGVRLTPAGRTLLPEARAVLASAARAMDVTRQALDLEPGTVEIATVPFVASGLLFSSLSRWHERHPAVTIRLREFTHRTRLEEAVAAGESHIGIGSRPSGWVGPITTLGWDELLVVAPARDNDVLKDTSVPLRDLATHDWVLYDATVNGLGDFVAAACGQAGFEPHAVVTTSQVDHAARLAAAGLGVALVPAKNVPIELRPTARQLDPPITLEIVAFTRNQWSPSAASFLELLREDDWPAPPEHGIPLRLDGSESVVPAE
jgi:DNA-binding transcriptional LysR family regulator